MADNLDWQTIWNEIPPRADRSKLESPLEEFFIGRLEKYLHPLVEIIPQYPVITSNGGFRLDFVLSGRGKLLVIECDGKDFHDEWRDEWRDALVLGTKKFFSIHRFRGKDIVYFFEDCIYLIYCDAPELFSSRYKEIYTGLVSGAIIDAQQSGELFCELREVAYCIEDEQEEISYNRYLRSERRGLNRRGHWCILLEFALNHPKLRLNSLIAEYEKQLRDGRRS